MRILIWNFGPRDPESVIWDWLQNRMQAVGHQVIAVDSMAMTAMFGQQGMQRVLLRYAQAYDVQAVLVLPCNGVEPRLLTRFRELGIVVIGFRFDDGLACALGQPRLTDGYWRLFRQYDAYCDLVVTVSQGMVAQALERDGTAPLYLPLPVGWQGVSAETRPMRPVVAYCGSPKYHGEAVLSWRVQVVRQLLAAGLPVELHHVDWSEVPGCTAAARPTPGLAAFFEVFRTSTVNLALASEAGPRPCPMIKGINLEIAAAGGMQIAQPSPELADHFSFDHDVATADTGEAIVQVARHFLAHPGEARQLGRNSRKAVERRGGWDYWWQRVAGALAGQGIHLPLDGAPQVPDPDIAAELAMLNLSLARAYESAGSPGLANHYYREASGLAPGEYHALAGIARHAADPTVAMAYWREATLSVEQTQSMVFNVGFPSPGSGTTELACRYEGARQWITMALAAGDHVQLLEAVAIAIPFHHQVARKVIDVLLQTNGVAAARAVADLHGRHWPDSPIRFEPA